jgi:hypothetical protein
VRWISTIGFEENLWSTYGGGEGAKGIGGRARQGGGCKRLMGGRAWLCTGVRRVGEGCAGQGGGRAQLTRGEVARKGRGAHG